MLKKLSPLFFLLFAISAQAQITSPQIDLNMALAVPINEEPIADTNSNGSLVAFGFGGAYMMPVFENSPIRVGASFRYMWLGGDARYFDFVDDYGDSYELKSEVKGSMSPLHLAMRLDPMNYTDFPVLPYIGGFFGIRFFGTNHRITIDYQDGTEPIVENNRQVSVTSSYGFEVGLHVRINQGILLDFRYETAYGGWAKYLDLTSIEIDNNGNATYDRLETRTDVAMFTLGIAILLNE